MALTSMTSINSITSIKLKTMKKILSLTAFAVGALTITSCSDFLDQTSPSEMNSTTVYNSTYYTGLRVNKLYAGMVDGDRTYDQDIPIKWGACTDVEVVGNALGAEAYNGTSYRGAGNYNASPGYSYLADSWDDMYAIIEDANLIIEGIRNSSLLGGEDDATMKRYLGEALTVRAMIYFDLLRYWGDIPLKLESSQPDLSNAYVGKTDRDDIMDTLILDLEEAIPYLPWAGEVAEYTTERVTKGFAHGLLAQIAMTRAGWAIRETDKSAEGYITADYTDPTYPTQRPDDNTRHALYEKALEHLSAIITNPTHSLNPSFADEWRLINLYTLDETYRENIFEIPMGTASTGDSGELGYSVGLRLHEVTSTYGFTTSSNNLCVTAPFLYSFDPKDTRRDITCATIEVTADTPGGVAKEAMLGNNPFSINIGKWDPRIMSQNSAWHAQNMAATTKQNTGINVVKMRYSQVLLYYAEVLNELAGSPDASYPGDAGITARQALMQVHTRAFDAEDQADAQAYVNGISAADFFDALVQENAWELAGENFRKWDLIRWNLLAQKIMEAKQTYLQQLQDGTYTKTVYFNYSDAAQTQIDRNSVTWYEDAESVNATEYDGSESSYGGSNDLTDLENDNVFEDLPSIASGLVGSNVPPLINDGTDPVVINRYLMPIASTTIAASNGTLSNSYGYTN